MRKKAKVLAALALIGALCINIGADISSATSITDIEEEKKQNKEKMDEAQAVVDQLKDEQNNIMSSIAALDQKVEEFNNEIIEIQAKKSEIESQIVVVQKELEIAKANVQKQYDAMKKRIQYAYENGNVDYVDVMFSTGDISDVINQSEYVDQMYTYDARCLDKLVEAKKEVANKELILQTSLDSIAEYEDQIKANQEAIQTMIDGKKLQVEKYEESIDGYEDVIAEYQQNIDNLDAQIAQIEAAIEEERRRKAEEARKKAQEEALKNGTTVSDDINIYYDPAPSTLQWPVPTSTYVTSEFGPRWGRNHNGMDIACPINTPIVACEAGTVVQSGYDSSMGNYIMIDHGGGMMTIYMHNTSFAASVGQTVVRGQVIAYSGNTGFSTGPHCHIGVRVNGSYVNPRAYLTY